MNANLLTPHLAKASRRHDPRGVVSIRDVAPRRRTVGIPAIKTSRRRRLPIAIRARA